MTIRSLAVLLAAIMMTIGGCSEDAPSEPDPEAFCAKDAAEAGQIPENDEQWGTYADTYEELAELAPDEIRPDVEKMSAAITKVAEGSQNFDDIYDEAGVSEASDSVRVWTSDNCSEGGGYFPGG